MTEFYKQMYKLRKEKLKSLSEKEREIRRLKYNAYMKEYLKKYRKNKAK